MSKELSLIKAKFIEDYKLKNSSNECNINLNFSHRLSNGDSIFIVEGVLNSPIFYRLKRVDLSTLTTYKTLDVDKKYHTNPIDKSDVVFWVNSKVGLNLLVEDVDFIIVDKDKLNVIISKQSIRFKNDFTIKLNKV